MCVCVCVCVCGVCVCVCVRVCVCVCVCVVFIIYRYIYSCVPHRRLHNSGLVGTTYLLSVSVCVYVQCALVHTLDVYHVTNIHICVYIPISDHLHHTEGAELGAVQPCRSVLEDSGSASSLHRVSASGGPHVSSRPQRCRPGRVG